MYRLSLARRGNKEMRALNFIGPEGGRKSEARDTIREARGCLDGVVGWYWLVEYEGLYYCVPVWDDLVLTWGCVEGNA